MVEDQTVEAGDEDGAVARQARSGPASGRGWSSSSRGRGRRGGRRATRGRASRGAGRGRWFVSARSIDRKVSHDQRLKGFRLGGPVNHGQA
jgi:hypothetical protein